ncbi:hypothetical protein JOC47_001709 [Halanaerobacter jeridensis]|uniref:Uncharacterized protein n=1 Tax=Halanaerobacter jeridensis TaxID=706427 RepID=A0A938XPF4_9FIRM|nr:hypothetical protein [Halanaerobacter jeridensis]
MFKSVSNLIKKGVGGIIKLADSEMKARKKSDSNHLV